MVQDFTGVGSRVVRPSPLRGPVLIYFQTSGCRSVTQLEGVGRDGHEMWWPFAVARDFHGVCLAEDAPGIAAFKITCDGSWSLSIRPIGDARRWESGFIQGTGFDVLTIPGGVWDLFVVDFVAEGRGVASVYAHQETQQDLVFNGVAPYQAQSILPVGTRVIAIHNNGPWSLTRV